MTKRPTDNAFPVYTEDCFDHGLSKREYFAARALQGLLANTDEDDDWVSCITAIPVAAVVYADRLIEELSKPTKS